MLPVVRVDGRRIGPTCSATLRGAGFETWAMTPCRCRGEHLGARTYRSASPWCSARRAPGSAAVRSRTPTARVRIPRARRRRLVERRPRGGVTFAAIGRPTAESGDERSDRQMIDGRWAVRSSTGRETAPGGEPGAVRGCRLSNQCFGVVVFGASSRGAGGSPRPSCAKNSALRYSKSSSLTSPAANFSFSSRNCSSSSSSLDRSVVGIVVGRPSSCRVGRRAFQPCAPSCEVRVDASDTTGDFGPSRIAALRRS